MYQNFDELDEIDQIDGLTEESKLETAKPQAISEHEIFLIEQTQRFKARQDNRRNIETIMALLLCSTLSGNASLILIEWGANWFIALLGGSSLGCTITASLSHPSDDKNWLTLTRHLIPIGSSIIATNDYRDKQWLAFQGIQSYKNDLQQAIYGDSIQPQPSNLLGITLPILALALAAYFFFKSDKNDLNF
jgi:hypothetical protein